MPKTNGANNSSQLWATIREILASGDSVEIKPGPKKTVKVIHKHRGTLIGTPKIEDIACP